MAQNTEHDGLPEPLVPKRTGFALRKHGSYPDISKPDREGYYWDYGEPPNIPAPSAPCISDEQMERVVNAVNNQLPEGEYPWSASRRAPDPPDTDYLEVRGRPEKGKNRLGENIRSMFRSKSPKERETGARRKVRNDQKSPSARKDPQIENDRAIALALSHQLEQRGADKEEQEAPRRRGSLGVTSKEREELEELERELQREREKEKERIALEERKEQIRLELKNIRLGRKGEKERDSHAKERERKEIEPVKRYKQGGKWPQDKRGLDHGSEYGYSSQDERVESLRPRRDPVRQVVQEQRGGTRRERGDTIHHISLEDRHNDSDSSDGEVPPIELVKRVKTLETNSHVGKISVPALADVPYPSDEYVGPCHTSSYRTISQYYRTFDNQRKFSRQPNEHILVFLRRVKRGIEGNKVFLDEGQFIEFICKYLDKETADLFHEQYEDIKNMDKVQFLDFVVTSVTDNTEEGEHTFKFWNFDPNLDSSVKNSATLVTKLSQLKAKIPKYTMEDIINKLMVILPTEYMEKIKKHRAHKHAIALDVLMFELNKFDKEITEFLMKGKKKPGVGVRAVHDVVGVVEVDDVGADGVVDGTEHLNMSGDSTEYVNLVPFNRYPVKKEDMGPNQYIAPPQQQQQRQQQQYPNHRQNVNAQGYTTKADAQKQPVCQVCFKYGHSAQTCNRAIYCCLCNGTDHISPACMVYPGCAPTYDDCPFCLRMFSLRLKHTKENCRLNSESQFSIEKMLTPNAQGNTKRE